MRGTCYWIFSENCQNFTTANAQIWIFLKNFKYKGIFFSSSWDSYTFLATRYIFTSFLVLRSESPGGKCANLHTVAASNNRDHPTRSLCYCLLAPYICMVLFFRHIPFMVNDTFNATPPERLQQHPLLFTANRTPHIYGVIVTPRTGCVTSRHEVIVTPHIYGVIGVVREGPCPPPNF